MQNVNELTKPPNISKDLLYVGKSAKKTSTVHSVQFNLDEPSDGARDLDNDLLDKIINDEEFEFINLDKKSDQPSRQRHNDEDDEVDDVDAIPDGGWGWVVCFGAFAINLVLLGIHNCFAILFYDLLKDFKQDSFKTAWIGSIAYGCILMFAPLSGYLSSKYGCRPIALIGVIIGAISLLISSFANSITMLYFTYGGGFGIGTSFAYTQGAVILSKYFSRRHSLASGFMLAGSSGGTLFMGKIYDLFHDHLGFQWRVILRVFAGLVFATTLCAATYKPLGKKKKSVKSSPQATKFIQELALWKNKAFMIWLVSVGLCKIGYLIPWVHLVKLSAEYGYDRSFGSNLLQWMGITATVSRLIIGKVTTMNCVNRLYLSQASAFLMGLVNVIQPKFLTYTGLIWYAVSLGCLDGGIEILLPVMTLELVGEEKLAIAWGCILCVVSVSSVGPPIGGAIHDSTGVYDGMFYFAGIPMIIAAFVLALIPLWAKKQPQHPALSYLSVDPSYFQQNESKLSTRSQKSIRSQRSNRSQRSARSQRSNRSQRSSRL